MNSSCMENATPLPRLRQLKIAPNEQVCLELSLLNRSKQYSQSFLVRMSIKQILQ